MGLRRWLVFNGVGVLGFGIQTTVLAILVHGIGLHYLAATVLAVETAILHNFFWHRRWTWRERRGSGLTRATAQLWRFHLLNGLVSLAGNMMMMYVLVDHLGWSPLRANAITVLACSVVNFAVSDRAVFRVCATTLLPVLVAVWASVPVAASDDDGPAGPEPTTLAAWTGYERLLDARYASGRSERDFFAHDAFGRDARWRANALAGVVPMFQASGAGPGIAEPDVPDGRIHHWIGAVYIPGATLDSVLRHLSERAGRESEAYEDVLASKLIARNGETLRVYMKLRRESVITVTYNTEHEVTYRRLGPARASSRSTATRIAELADAGGPREREKAAGEDHGFLWRLNAYWRYEEVGGGVLIECESVSLSRGVPLLLKPLVSRTVDRIARESLQRTLESLRKALTGSVATVRRH